MSRWANRLLNILLCAPAAVLAMAATTPVVHAGAVAPPPVPQPYVVAIDPGHGGAPNNSDPTQLFDPGAIGTNGVQEKDVTVDISEKLKSLLEAYHVKVVLTRTTDVYVGIDQRSATARKARADFFVSIHENSFPDPASTGSLVLYPNDNDLNYANTIENAVAAATPKVPNMGTQLRDNWWIHLPMPACTVESAYLSNPDEAAMMATEQYRAQVAQGVLKGLLAYSPDIATRSVQIEKALRARQAAAALRPSRPAAAGGGGFPLMQWAIVAALAYAVIRYRHIVVPRGVELVGYGMSLRKRNRHRLEQRRRRAVVRARVVANRTRTVAKTGSIKRPHSVYDEIAL